MIVWTSVQIEHPMACEVQCLDCYNVESKYHRAMDNVKLANMPRCSASLTPCYRLHGYLIPTVLIWLLQVLVPDDWARCNAPML